MVSIDAARPARRFKSVVLAAGLVAAGLLAVPQAAHADPKFCSTVRADGTLGSCSYTSDGGTGRYVIRSIEGTWEVRVQGSVIASGGPGSTGQGEFPVQSGYLVQLEITGRVVGVVADTGGAGENDICVEVTQNTSLQCSYKTTSDGSVYVIAATGNWEIWENPPSGGFVVRASGGAGAFAGIVQHGIGSTVSIQRQSGQLVGIMIETGSP